MPTAGNFHYLWLEAFTAIRASQLPRPTHLPPYHFTDICQQIRKHFGGHDALGSQPLDRLVYEIEAPFRVIQHFRLDSKKRWEFRRHRQGVGSKSLGIWQDVEQRISAL